MSKPRHEPAMEGTKVCTRCGREKPLSDFSPRRDRPAGQVHPACKVCANEQSRAYYAANRERLQREGRDRMRAARQADPEPFRERDRKRAKSPERMRRNREQYHGNELAWIARVIRRKAKLRGAVILEDVVPLVVLERDDGVCGICGEDVDPFDFHVDHIVPASRGGEHSYGNVQLAHPACNVRKHNRLLAEEAAA